MRVRERRWAVVVATAALLGCRRGDDPRTDARSGQLQEDVESPDEAVRRRALISVCTHYGAVSGEQARTLAALLRERAKDRNDPIRPMYLDALACLPVDGAVLATVLADEAEPVEIRMKAAAIVDARSLEGETALGRVFESKVTALPLRIVAARGLGSGCRTATPILLRHVDDDPFLGEAVAQSLAALGEAPALVVLMAVRDPTTRAAAIAAASGLGEVAAGSVPTLAALLRQPEHRGAALSVMGRIGVPAVPALAAALRSADADLRLGAADTLRGVRDGAKEAIPALRILASKDPDLRVRQAAKLALHDVGPTLQELAAFLERVPAADTKVRILKGIEAALGPLGARGAEMVPPLRRALQDESPSVRGEALSALVMIGEPAMVALDDIVARLHGDSNSWIRSKAALDLAHLHRAATTPDARARIVTELEAAQQDPEKEVRQAVAQTLRGARAGWQKRRERCEAAR